MPAGEVEAGREEEGDGVGERRLGLVSGSESESECDCSCKSFWDSLIVALSRCEGCELECERWCQHLRALESSRSLPRAKNFWVWCAKAGSALWGVKEPSAVSVL